MSEYKIEHDFSEGWNADLWERTNAWLCILAEARANDCKEGGIAFAVARAAAEDLGVPLEVVVGLLEIERGEENMDKGLTTKTLKRIAEACGIALDEDGLYLGTTKQFTPHLGATQAAECLRLRFGKPDDDGFTICFSPWLEAEDQWQVDAHDSTGCARTFPAAAMAAILASLKD